MAARRKSAGYAVEVDGVKKAQAALAKVSADATAGVRRTLREGAGDIAEDARANITHPVTGALGRGIRVGATARGAVVFNDAPHAVVQDVGGKVGRGRSTVLTRSTVSQYMTRAGRDGAGKVVSRVDRLLKRIESDFKGGP